MPVNILLYSLVCCLLFRLYIMQQVLMVITVALMGGYAGVHCRRACV